jgi:hypothetical protein
MRGDEVEVRQRWRGEGSRYIEWRLLDKIEEKRG